MSAASDVVGIYRVDGPNRLTVVADIGRSRSTIRRSPRSSSRAESSTRCSPIVADSWSPTGTTTACIGSRSTATVSELIAFGDIVPTGLAVRGRTIYMAEAGPVPHLPENGKVVTFGPKSTTATQVASGAPLLVDVEFGRGHRLYALSQGHFSPATRRAPRPTRTPARWCGSTATAR